MTLDSSVSWRRMVKSLWRDFWGWLKRGGKVLLVPCLLSAPLAEAGLTYRGRPLADLQETVDLHVEFARVTRAELVCYDGLLYEEVCYGPEGGSPCTRRPPRLLADQVERHRGCGGMSVLGTAALVCGVHSADLISTGAADRLVDGTDSGLTEGRLVEANPLGQSTLELVGLKIAACVGATAAIHTVERKKPGLALWMRRLTVLGLGLVSVHNLRNAFAARPEVE